MYLKKILKVFPNTLASRLTLWYGLAFVVFFSVAFSVFYFFVSLTIQRNVDEDLIEDILEVRKLSQSTAQSTDLERIKQEIQREANSENPEDVFLRLMDGEGRVIFSSDMSHWSGLAPNQAMIESTLEENDPILETIFREIDGIEFRVIHGVVAPDAVLQIGETMEDARDFMGLLLELFFFVHVLVIPLGALMGWLMAKKALEGIEAVSRAAEDIANGNPTRQVQVRAHGMEIERLVTTFNAMVDRIHTLISGMREMTDNIAHDMKSPLARIRTNSELALSKARTVEEFQVSAMDTLEDCDRMLQMINVTLDVAEAEAGAGYQKHEPVDLANLVSKACDLFEPVAEDKGIRLSCNVEIRRVIQGDRQRLQRMLANLIDNGIKYTQPPGEVEVTVSADGEKVGIAVCDTGIGIAESEQGKVFNRFFRCDQSRTTPGFGLGLSFSRAVARTHGGDIQLSSKPGVGSIFTVTLPILGQ